MNSVGFVDTWTSELKLDPIKGGWDTIGKGLFQIALKEDERRELRRDWSSFTLTCLNIETGLKGMVDDVVESSKSCLG